MESTTQSTPKMGSIRRGWLLTKSAWHVLRLDKELASLQAFSFIIALLSIIPFVGLLLLNSSVRSGIANLGSGVTSEIFIPAWQSALLTFGVYFVTTLVANFFSGAVIYGAVQRFRGGNPSLGSSLAGARRKFRPLILFSLLMSTVGLALHMLEERLPFAGRIAVYFFDAAWSLANVFAIPVIVLSDEDVHPLDATKRSVGIIKKVWGESIVVNLGISLIGMLTFLAYFIVWGALGAVFAALVSPLLASNTTVAVFAVILAGLALLGFMAIVLIFITLGSIAKAALYFYATTGQAPASFDSQLLQTAMTPKKARKIFS